jgi:cholesterol oxidase
VNPLLTISALAERTAAWIATQRGWTIDYGAQPARRAVAPAAGMLIEFTERIRGWVSEGSSDPEHGLIEGMRSGTELWYELSMAGDVEASTVDPAEPTKAVGVIGCPALSDELISVTGGFFQLFVDDPASRTDSKMVYEMPMRTADGRSFHLSGYKNIRRSTPWNLWYDTTTLFATVRHDGPDGDPWGCGVLRISPADFARQLTTMRVSGSAPLDDRLAALVRYGRMFAGHLFDYYAGPLGWWRLREKDEATSPTSVGDDPWLV